MWWMGRPPHDGTGVRHPSLPPSRAPPPRSMWGRRMPRVHRRRRNKATFNLSPINNVQLRRPPLLTASRNKKKKVVGGGGFLDWDIISGSAHWVTHGSLVLFNVASVTDIWEALLIWFVSLATVCWRTCQNKIRGTAQILIYHRCHPLTCTLYLKKKKTRNKTNKKFLKCKTGLWIESDILRVCAFVYTHTQI